MSDTVGRDTARLKHQLSKEFGLYVAPLAKVVNSKTLPTLHELRLAYREFKAGEQDWGKCVQRFLKVGKFPLVPPQFGYVFSADLLNLEDDLFDTSGRPPDLQKLHNTFRDILQSREKTFFAQLDMIPTQWDPTSLRGEAPLSAYMKIKDALLGVKRRVHYFDRYLRDDIFALYLRDLDRSLEIRLVTTVGTSKGDYGVTQVRAASDLARVEFTNYQLIEVVPQALHDRKLRVDDDVFIIGSGITPGGHNPAYPNEFAPADSSTAGHQSLDDIIQKGTIVHQS